MSLNLFVFIFHESLIFQGANVPKSTPFKFDKNFEEYLINTPEGGEINLVHFKISNPYGMILYFHGNRGDLRKWGRISSKYTDLGYDVFAWDYRGYGRSTGKRTENLLYQDAEEVLSFIDENFRFDKKVFFGRSLGSAMAIHLATKNSPDLLILETPIAHVSNGIHRYRWFMPKGVIWRFQFDNQKKASDVMCKTVILHGTNDYVIPIFFAKRLFDELGSDSKKIVIIPKGGHNNLNNFEKYHNTLKSTLTNYESIPEN